MAALPIRAHRKLPDFLVTTKEVGPEPTSVETPARARPVELFEPDEELLDCAYGFAEVHVEVSTQDLNFLADGSTEDLEQWIAEETAAIRDDEISVAVVEYTGRGIVNIPGMEALVGVLDEHFEVLVGLLMSKQLDTVDDLDANPEPYDRYVENSERFLGAVDAVATDSAVLGTIPVLLWGRMEELLDLHFEQKVDGFCVDFLDLKPTADHRINGCIAPLMNRLGKERSYRNSLLYAVNAYRGKNRTGRSQFPAGDFFVFGLGFDVLGGRHYISQSGGGGYGEISFRCFDYQTYELEYVRLEALPDELPEETALSQQYLTTGAHDDDDHWRIQVLLEVEQMNVAYDELRAAIHAGRTVEFITEKAGTLGRLETLMETVQDAYDEGYSNPSLSSY